MVDAGDRFIEEHEALVRSVARKLKAQFELTAELDDLVAAGFAGLWEARSRYDAARGVQFSTFAYYRVRGAILDHARKSSHLSRRAYERIRQAEDADAIAEGVAEARAADPASRGDKARTTQALDDTIARLTSSFALSCLGQDEAEPPASPEAGLLEREAAERLRRAVEALPERERALVEGHYFHGRRFDEVAAELGVSKSWASRIHTKALDLLREAMESG